MIQSRRGKIVEELFSRQGIKAFHVDLDGSIEKCITYTGMTDEIFPGDEVLLNTTAGALGLGTGGYHFVISKVNADPHNYIPGGHIMKLRYTPMQIKVLSVEEEDSPYHEIMAEAESLDNIPVLVVTLHSMLLPLCLMLGKQGLKTAYVMTDGAALPMAFSHTVDWLKKQSLLIGTISTGHAFGGDLEAVNVYSGMLAARKILKADVIIVGMGPGIVGTGTKWGFTGIEQGEILNAAAVLNGIPVAVPRISFADKRSRHQGISHHTLTVLSKVCQVKAKITLPILNEEKMTFLLEQLRQEGITNRHEICVEDGQQVMDLIKESGFKITTMGRGVEEEKEFFLSLGASAVTALRLVRGEKLHYLQLV